LQVTTAAEESQASGRVGADGGAEVVQGASIGRDVEKLLVEGEI
jgi:hypothetical protein